MHVKVTLEGICSRKRTGRWWTRWVCPVGVPPRSLFLFDDHPFSTLTVSAMAHSLTVPSSAKVRLCPSAKTTDFGHVLEHAGASWITLHARHVSAKRRRQGAADLDAIRELKQALAIPVISNGNVRTFSDVEYNASYTRADGIMVGETLLGNPWWVSVRLLFVFVFGLTMYPWTRVTVACFRATRRFGILFRWPWNISRSIGALGA